MTRRVHFVAFVASMTRERTFCTYCVHSFLSAHLFEHLIGIRTVLELLVVVIVVVLCCVVLCCVVSCYVVSCYVVSCCVLFCVFCVVWCVASY